MTVVAFVACKSIPEYTRPFVAVIVCMAFVYVMIHVAFVSNWILVAIVQIGHVTVVSHVWECVNRVVKVVIKHGKVVQIV